MPSFQGEGYYTETDLTPGTGLITGVDAAGRRVSYDPQVWFSAMSMSIMAMLEGPNTPDTRAIIPRDDDLRARGGITLSKNIYHPPPVMRDGTLGAPNKMDQDLHGLEETIQNDPMTISIEAYRKSFMDSELQKQYPAEELDVIIAKMSRNWLIEATNLHALCALTDRQFVAADSSGYIWGAADMGTFYCRNQVYPNGKSKIEHLSSGDKFTARLLSIGDVILTSGLRRTGDYTFRALKPVVNGESVNSLILMHPIVRDQMTELDPSFRAALLQADPRGPGNRIWTGLAQSFKWMGHLIWVLADGLQDALLIAAGETIYDDSGNASVAQFPCAITPMLMARSAMRVVGRRPDEADAREPYDLSWFTRFGAAAVQGYAPCKVTHPIQVPSATRELGRLMIYSYAEHPAAHTFGVA